MIIIIPLAAWTPSWAIHARRLAARRRLFDDERFAACKYMSLLAMYCYEEMEGGNEYLGVYSNLDEARPSGGCPSSYGSTTPAPSVASSKGTLACPTAPGLLTCSTSAFRRQRWPHSTSTMYRPSRTLPMCPRGGTRWTRRSAPGDPSYRRR